MDGPARRQRKVTPAHKRKFCKAIADGASVTKACEALEISRAAMYYQRNIDPEFDEAWDDAFEHGTDRYEDRLHELAMETTNPVPTFGELRHRRPESLMRLSRLRRLSRRVYYTENDVPQPQVFLALGFANTKPLPLSPSEKSSSVPAR